MPEPRSRGGALDEFLDLLTPGMALDVPREEGAVRDAIYRYRRMRGREHRFVVRSLRNGWSRVWRTAGIAPVADAGTGQGSGLPVR